MLAMVMLLLLLPVDFVSVGRRTVRRSEGRRALMEFIETLYDGGQR
jgi:hypothetical protein